MDFEKINLRGDKSLFEGSLQIFEGKIWRHQTCYHYFCEGIIAVIKFITTTFVKENGVIKLITAHILKRKTRSKFRSSFHSITKGDDDHFKVIITFCPSL